MDTVTAAASTKETQPTLHLATMMPPQDKKNLPPTSLADSVVAENDDDAIITRRLKRKADGSPETSESQLKSLFETFSREFTEKLNLSQASLESNISTKILEATNNIKTEISGLQAQHATLRSDLAEFKQTLDFNSNEIENHTKQISVLNKNARNTTITEKEVATMKLELASFQHELNDYKQRERLFNVEIIGIPEKPAENLPQYLIKLAETLDIALAEDDITRINRVQPAKPLKGQPKAIVAKLKSQEIKDALISAFRKNKGLHSTDIGILGEKKKIFLNEHLTRENKILFKKVREAAKMYEYKYAWIKNCKIFVRKDKDSAHLLIKCDADISKIK